MNARRVSAGDIIFFTRYVHGGENRFRPDPEALEGIGYFAAVFSEKHNIELNALCYPGNHEHGVGADAEEKMPDFTRDLHANITKHLNRHYGEQGSMWDSRQTNQVRLINPEDVVAKIAYIDANPVKHQFVESADDFPGFRMRWPCPPRTFKRPDWLDEEAIDDNGELKWPAKATLTMHRPRGFDDLTDAKLAEKLEKACRGQEEEFREEVLDRPGKFAGRKKVERWSHRRRPKRSPRKRRQITPTIACKDPVMREAAIEEERAWRADYRERLKRWSLGDRTVVFPSGTYKMRLVHGVAVEASPP